MDGFVKMVTTGLGAGSYPEAPDFEEEPLICPLCGQETDKLKDGLPFFAHDVCPECYYRETHSEEMFRRYLPSYIAEHKEDFLGKVFGKIVPGTAWGNLPGKYSSLGRELAWEQYMKDDPADAQDVMKDYAVEIRQDWEDYLEDAI